MMRILDALFPPRNDEALLRTLSKDGLCALIAPRIVSTTRPATTVLLPFGDDRVRAALHEAKYHGSEHAFMLLAHALAEYLCDMDDWSRTVVLVSVPLGKERLRERGYNQVSEVIRRALNILGKQPAFHADDTLLQRVRETSSQVSLPRHEREQNMRGAFSAPHIVDPSVSYVLIDDVTTTGATLQAALQALHDAGALSVTPLALAH